MLILLINTSLARMSRWLSSEFSYSNFIPALYSQTFLRCLLMPLHSSWLSWMSKYLSWVRFLLAKDVASTSDSCHSCYPGIIVWGRWLPLDLGIAIFILFSDIIIPFKHALMMSTIRLIHPSHILIFLLNGVRSRNQMLVFLGSTVNIGSTSYIETCIIVYEIQISLTIH